MRCKYDRIKYLIQIAYYIVLIFQRSKGERVNVAVGSGLRQRCVQNMSAQNDNIPTASKTEAIISSP